MKSSIHLLYGIIIGILLVACTGSIKKDKAEFKEEKVFYCSLSTSNTNQRILELKKEGWTIIDIEGLNSEDRHGHKLEMIHAGR